MGVSRLKHACRASPASRNGKRIRTPVGPENETKGNYRATRLRTRPACGASANEFADPCTTTCESIRNRPRIYFAQAALARRKMNFLLAPNVVVAGRQE